MFHRVSLILAVLGAVLFGLVACDAKNVSTNLPQLETTRMSVLRVGDKSPDVILIPGLATPREVWDGLGRHLADKTRLHLVEINGFGAGKPGLNAKGGVIEGVTEDLSRYIAEQHLEKPLVIGHSMGGIIALKLSLAHPELVGRLMVVDTLPFLAMLFDPNATLQSVEPRAAQMRDQLLRASSSEAAASAATLSNTTEGQAQIASWSAKADRNVMAHTVYEQMTTDLRPDLGRLQVPLTIVYPVRRSDKDPASTLYKTAYSSVKSKFFIAIPDSYHFVMLDQPRPFEKAVDGFIWPQDK